MLITPKKNYSGSGYHNEHIHFDSDKKLSSISTPFSLNKMDVEEIRVVPNKHQIYNPFAESIFKKAVNTNVNSASKSECVLGSDQKSNYSQNAGFAD